MPRLLPDLLFPSADFNIAELHAARLDGELSAIDAGFAPLDCPSTVELRLRALVPLLPESAIVERQSASWAYGFRPNPPLRHQACVHAGVGRRVPGSVRLQVREVVLAEDDIVTRYGVPVTSLLRTAVDLARSLTRVDDAERAQLRDILAASHATLPEATAMLDRCRSMPNKRRAVARLTEAMAH